VHFVKLLWLQLGEVYEELVGVLQRRRCWEDDTMWRVAAGGDHQDRREACDANQEKYGTDIYWTGEAPRILWAAPVVERCIISNSEIVSRCHALYDRRACQ
jgi:hypothetical protein